MKRRSVLVAAGGAAAGLAGCAALGAGGCADEDHDVGMSDSAFEPTTLTVEPGTTVRWLNTTTRAHTVTAYEGRIPEGTEYFASGGFDSEAAAREAWDRGEGAIYTCESYEHTFEQPGEYHYFCIPHEGMGMVGAIYVEEGATTQQHRGNCVR